MLDREHILDFGQDLWLHEIGNEPLLASTTAVALAADGWVIKLFFWQL